MALWAADAVSADAAKLSWKARRSRLDDAVPTLCSCRVVVEFVVVIVVVMA